MTSHTIHPPSLDEGLADDCPRCSQHAADPLGGQLDLDHVRDLWDRMLGVEFGSTRSDAARAALLNGYRTENESIAGHRLYLVAIFLRGIGVDPEKITPGEGVFCPRCGAMAPRETTCGACGYQLSTVAL